MTQRWKLPVGATLAVHLCWDAGREVRVGRLGMRDRRVLFEFDSEFLRSGLEISPFKLRRGPGVIEGREPIFENLPGVFNDSLPDGWGRLLLDREVRRQGVPPASLTPLDRLAHIGRDGIGALVYQPELGPNHRQETVELDELAQASRAVLEGSSEELLEKLRRLGGSPQGDRPKALVQIHEPTGQLTDALHDRGPDWRHFIVKFAAQADVSDVGPLELAWSRMAAAAGVRVPESRLLASTIGPGYFAAARFDRQGSARLHVITASGLLHADHRVPSLDYVDLAKVAVRLTGDHREGEMLFRLMVFNVFAHNRDDHAKQFSFTLDSAGTWRLAPAYDLTFSGGMAGEHTTAIAGNGRDPRAADMLKVADAAGLKRTRALEILAEVREVTGRWRAFCEHAGVSGQTMRWMEHEAQLGDGQGEM